MTNGQQGGGGRTTSVEEAPSEVYSNIVSIVQVRVTSPRHRVARLQLARLLRLEEEPRLAECV